MSKALQTGEARFAFAYPVTPVRSLKSMLPAYVTRPRTRLASGATVTKLIAADNGEVVGAEARDLDGTRRTIRAGIYVIAAGAAESKRFIHTFRSNNQRL